MTTLASKKVVLVDDQIAMLSLTKSLLESKGVRNVSVARGGAAGLNLIHEMRPDLVLCDIEMPGMSGLEVLQEIRTGRAGVSEHTPVIFLTGHSDSDLVRTAIALDANGFIKKPLPIRDLIARIEALLSQQRSYRDILEYRAVIVARR